MMSVDVGFNEGMDLQLLSNPGMQLLTEAPAMFTEIANPDE